MQAMATDKRKKANKSLSKIQYWWMRWNNRIEDLAFYFCNEHCVFLENTIRNKKPVQCDYKLSWVSFHYNKVWCITISHYTKKDSNGNGHWKISQRHSWDTTSSFIISKAIRTIKSQSCTNRANVLNNDYCLMQ